MSSFTSPPERNYRLNRFQAAARSFAFSPKRASEGHALPFIFDKSHFFGQINFDDEGLLQIQTHRDNEGFYDPINPAVDLTQGLYLPDILAFCQELNNSIRNNPRLNEDVKQDRENIDSCLSMIQLIADRINFRDGGHRYSGSPVEAAVDWEEVWRTYGKRPTREEWIEIYDRYL